MKTGAAPLAEVAAPSVSIPAVWDGSKPPPFESEADPPSTSKITDPENAILSRYN